MNVLETQRLTLRWVTADDASFILELLNDPGWIQYIGDRGVRTEDDARRYIAEKLTASYERHGFGLNLVVEKASGAPVGLCGLIKRDTLDDVDVGFAFLPRWRGLGYARESAAAALEHGRRELGLTRVVAITLPENAASIRVLEGLGLRFERTIRWADDEELALYSRELAKPSGEGRATEGRAMDDLWRTVLWLQFGGAIDALEGAIRECPDSLWGDLSNERQFWYLAYHTLFFLDYYTSETADGFAPPAPFTMSEADPRGILPDRVYTKEELLAYLTHGREKARKSIAGMTTEKAREVRKFPSIEGPVVEIHLHSMRHVQHHTAQLNLLMRQAVNRAPRWVKRGSR